MSMRKPTELIVSGPILLSEKLKEHSRWVRFRESSSFDSPFYKRSNKNGRQLILKSEDISHIHFRATSNLRYAKLARCNLRGCVMNRCSLAHARFIGCSMALMDLRRADLKGATFYSCQLTVARLGFADLRGATFSRSTNLHRANLKGAKLYGADLPAPTVLLLADWDDCSDQLTRALMRLDASAHPEGVKPFTNWAHGGSCPYGTTAFKRAAHFQEKPELWDASLARRRAPTIWEATEMVLNEHCPGWR